MKDFTYYLPTRILFGVGALGRLHEQALPGKKALIVTTAGQSVKKYGYLARVEQELDRAGAGHVLFDKILPNPVLAHVMEGAALAREAGADFVIGLGGGSSIDSAKSIAVMAANPGDYWDYVTGSTGGQQAVPNPPLPIVAITTTAGTGTEADPWTVITKPETNEKVGYGFDGTFPVLSVVDPELMKTVPPRLTAYQGFDALFHSTEGYLNKAANPMSDLFALRAISLVGKSLAAAVTDGDNIEARADIALANTLAGMVESTSDCTSEHAIAHAISAFHPSFEHGAALISISCAYYSHFASTGACEERLVDMAKALGRPYATRGADFVDALRDLQKACGVEALAMSGYGMKRGELSKYAENARATMGCLYGGDPVPLSDSDVVKILEESFR